MSNKYDKAFLKCAEAFAECSVATRLRVGCVFEKDGAIISVGLNGTVKGWYTNVCEDENGLTKPEVLHAEENCILKLAENGISAKGATAYITHSCCRSCASKLYAIGIKRVVYKTEYRCLDGVEWLRSKGVVVDKVD